MHSVRDGAIAGVCETVSESVGSFLTAHQHITPLAQAYTSSAVKLYENTKNTFCETWYLPGPYSQVHNN